MAKTKEHSILAQLVKCRFQGPDMLSQLQGMGGEEPEAQGAQPVQPSGDSQASGEGGGWGQWGQRELADTKEKPQTWRPELSRRT